MKYTGPASFLQAVQALSILPGVGEKTAQRLIFSLMKHPDEKIMPIVEALQVLKNQLRLCEICFVYTQEPRCPICMDRQRDEQKLCVVEDPTNVFAIEKSGQFQGVYHVLHGVLAPLEGIGPEDIKIQPLLDRLQLSTFSEVILATSPNVEGDATALYLSQKIHAMGIPVTRIAQGIPSGGSLEYTDQYTLGKAINDRRAWG
jgi:recombination protein RecR